jgi:predicted PurR-regulated permease PerM
MPESILSKRVITLIILIALLILTFLIIRPFFAAIFLGFVIAYILQWPYKKLTKLIKKKGVSAAIICAVFVIILVVGIYFLGQITIKEAFNLYMNMGKINFASLIDKIISWAFPNSPDIATQISTTIQVTITDLVNSYVTSMKKAITDMPKLFVDFFITFFVAFYGLRDGEKILNYIKEILPFSHDINEKFVKRSKDIAFATIYGQIIVGLIQGVTAGIGFYIFRAQSPLFFTLLAVFFAILPLLGAWIVWIPVSISLIASGHTMNGIFLFIYGTVVVSTIDNIVRPYIVGKKGAMNPVIILLGMIGGLTLIGPIGLVVGPLILEYALIFIELYRVGKIGNNPKK